MKVNVPYGKNDSFEIDVPGKQLLGVFDPNDVKKVDSDDAIDQALANPFDSESFNNFIDTSDRIVFIVNDGTRPTPTAKVLKHIYPKIKDKNIFFIVATGVHRAPTEEEYEMIFGKDIYEDLNNRNLIHSHDSKNDEMEYLGKSSNGTEMYINKIVADAKKLYQLVQSSHITLLVLLVGVSRSYLGLHHMTQFHKIII